MKANDENRGRTVTARAALPCIFLTTVLWICATSPGCRLSSQPGPPQAVPTIAESPTTSLGDLDSSPDEVVFPATGPSRPVFRHAVVPGGVFSKEEVWHAGFQWPEVQAHYGRLDIERLQLQKLEKSKQAHVSYRKGSGIYWTSYTMNVPAGETVLTDGLKSIRARCGNLISELPQEPVLPDEPAPEELDTPVPNVLPLSVDAPLAPVTTLFPPRFKLPIFFIPLAFGPGINKCGKTKHSDPDDPDDPDPPGPVVPEMPSWCYTSLGLAALATIYALRRRRRRVLEMRS